MSFQRFEARPIALQKHVCCILGIAQQQSKAGLQRGMTTQAAHSWDTQHASYGGDDGLVLTWPSGPALPHVDAMTPCACARIAVFLPRCRGFSSHWHMHRCASGARGQVSHCTAATCSQLHPAIVRPMWCCPVGSVWGTGNTWP